MPICMLCDNFQHRCNINVLIIIHMPCYRCAHAAMHKIVVMLNRAKLHSKTMIGFSVTAVFGAMPPVEQ